MDSSVSFARRSDRSCSRRSRLLGLGRTASCAAAADDSVAIASSIKVEAGYEREDLRARTDSGLEQANGENSASVDRGWAGGQITLPPVVFSLHAGRQRSTARDEWTYDGGAPLRAGDAVRLTYSHEHGLMRFRRGRSHSVWCVTSIEWLSPLRQGCD